MNNEKMVPAKLYWSLYHKNIQLQEEINNLLIKDNHVSEENRCMATKKHGKPCKQRGLSHQSGGEIINGFCGWHDERCNLSI
jgi:hypothetical protein